MELALENQSRFMTNYQLLMLYKEKHGNCNVPKNHPALGRFVKYQRNLYRNGKLPEERIAMLEKIGFDFCAGICGTIDKITDQLDVLQQFQAEFPGRMPHKLDANPKYAQLAQWIYRIRKLHNGGYLSTAAIKHIEKAGIKLERSPKKASAIKGLTKAAFQNNYGNLRNWLDRVERSTGSRNLAYQDTKLSEEARKSYRFVEHMILKARQALLPADHYSKLVNLAFTVNWEPIATKLMPRASIRSPDAVTDAMTVN